MNELLQPVVDSVNQLSTEGVPVIIELPARSAFNLVWAICLIILFFFLAKAFFAQL